MFFTKSTPYIHHGNSRLEPVNPRNEEGVLYRRIEVPGSSAMTLACHAMVVSGLPDPNKRLGLRNLKFFFTEYGWRNCGHAVLSEVRAKEQLAKVIAVKENDPRINVRYRDKWQVALLFGGRLPSRTRSKSTGTRKDRSSKT